MADFYGNRVGQELSNYRLMQYLANGAFAEVYLGEHIHLHTRAAIKLLRAQLTDDQIELFHIEARIIASLVHPNIVRVLDFDVEHTTNTPFIVMDYAPNGTLRQRHPRGIQLPLAMVVSYVKQVAAALQYAHNQEFIHGQVQPTNMLIGSNNEVLLNHFRFHISSNLSLISPKYELMGSPPAHIAPELMKGQLSQASDQYALGSVVYEWLSGERLFERYSPRDRMIMQLHGQTPSLHDIVPTISPTIEEVVLRALAQDPKQRFPNIQDFANVFEQAYQNQHYPYDVALSYAGEDRDYANVLANVLRSRGVKVFYDKYEKAVLWGEDLYTYLSDL